MRFEIDTHFNDRCEELLGAVRTGKFAFVDLGSGTGDSITACERRFKETPGVGFDISLKKVRAAWEKGLPVALADVTEVSFPDRCVSFVTMLDFLEHLFSLHDAIRVLRAAGRLARDFLYIRHPSFEHCDYLAQYGLKLSWSDWSGHRNMMTLAQFREVFASFGWHRYLIIPRKQILDSSHPSIVPCSAPCNVIRYDSAFHELKPDVFFNEPVFSQFDIYVQLNDSIPRERWERIVGTSMIEERYLETARHASGLRERLTVTNDKYCKEKDRRVSAEAKYRELKSMRQKAALEKANER